MSRHISGSQVCAFFGGMAGTFVTLHLTDTIWLGFVFGPICGVVAAVLYVVVSRLAAPSGGAE